MLSNEAEKHATLVFIEKFAHALAVIISWTASAMMALKAIQLTVQVSLSADSSGSYFAKRSCKFCT
jgi:hypothetical protein